MLQEIHNTQAQHTTKDVVLCDLTLPRVTLIITNKMSSKAEYLATQARIKSALNAGYRLHIRDAEITIDNMLGLYIIECNSNQLDLI
jgi:hypothetical protein